MSMIVVILAGGEGRRIGGSKPVRLLGGLTLLDRAARNARRWSSDVAIARRDPTQLGQLQLPAILDDPTIEGPLGGLASALRHARERSAETLLTIPADMPFLPPDLATGLGVALVPGVSAVIAGSGGHLHPVCGLWRARAADRLPAYVASGRRSLRGFAETVGFATVDWPAEPFDPFFNINTAEDLQAAERLLD